MYRKVLRMITSVWNSHVVCTDNYFVINYCIATILVYTATVRHRPSLEFDERSVRHHITNFYKQNKWKPGVSKRYACMCNCMYVFVPLML